MNKPYKKPTLIHAFIPLFTLIVLLSINVWIYGSDSTQGPNQTAMLLASAVGTIVALRLNYRWRHIEKKIVESINSAMSAILILMVIGALSGSWLLSGIVPAMIYYGLKILNPTFFLIAACIISGIVSLATGSSWSTIATMGKALLGIGATLGIDDPVIAGAIISGAYFGDKMSPLSDTTNLAPAMAGTNIFTHIPYMMYTTFPSLGISLLIFLVWGLTLDTAESASQIASVSASIDQVFNMNPILFVVPSIVFYLILKKVPALPVLLIGAIFGCVFAVLFQPQVIYQISGVENGDYTNASFRAIINALSGTIHVHTSNPMVSKLLTTSGMFGMMNTIWLIICAMIFGGVMESCGLLKVIADVLMKQAKSTGSLVAATASTCIFFNLTASDQYMAIAVPGRMYSDTYRKRGYKPELLSRTLEDSGTVTSVVIPWNTCGAAQSAALGVSTFAYLPYCFFCLISPFMTVLHAYLNIKIRKLDGDKST